MPIRYTCSCGANIRLPNNVAGRKARCTSCGLVFIVPTPEPTDASSTDIPLEPELPYLFQKRTTDKPKTKEFEPVSLEYGDRDDILAPAHERPKPTPSEPFGKALDDNNDDLEPRRSYWADLVVSFLFFLDTGSLITFIFIAIIQMGAMGLRFFMGSSILSIIANIVVWGYLCNFYMSVVKETASGEEELPNPNPDGLAEAVGAAFQFFGTFVWVMLPVLAFAVFQYANYGNVNAQIANILMIVGLFFWPVVMLGVSIGGGFHGLWPHTIIRTALAAPMAYLVLCGVLIATVGINYLPSADFVQPLIDFVRAKSSSGPLIVLSVASVALTTYTTIVAMRAIGLYYRHFKHRFPWSAE